MIKNIFITIVMMLMLVSAAAAQDLIEADEEALFSDEEMLFGDDDLINEIEAEEDDLSILQLKSEGVEKGGRFRFEVDSSWVYDSAEGPFGADLTDDPLSLDLGASVFMDARPYEDFRVFGKVDVSFPFTEQSGTRSFDDVFHVTELFSDFQLGDEVFFRAGKQTINWGVGYFFSPADLLNITEIDPQDPESELEGPASLKIHMPVRSHNLYLYTVFDDADSMSEIALAPKAELVIGSTEIGLGAFVREGNAPAFMTTLTTSVLDFDIFAEGIISYGSNRTFVVEDSSVPLGVTAKSYTDQFFPSATAGFRYSYSDDLDHFNVSLSAQYLYNGEGYADHDFLKNHSAGAAALLLADDLSMSDLSGTGRRYGAVSGAWTGMFGSDFDLACMWIGNLADGSGTIIPSLRWNAIDYLDITLKTGLMYGDPGGEYTPTGDAMTLSVSAVFGTGSF